MRKAMLASAMAAAAIAPASAQTTVTEYNVIQEPTTKRCTIVEQRPSASLTLDLGIFRTGAEAELGARRSKVCVYDD